MPDISQSPESSDSRSSSEPELEKDSQFNDKKQGRRYSQPQKTTKPKNKSLLKQQTAHNIIEKRYRNNLNNKIAALRDSVPSLRITTKGDSSRGESIDGNLDERNKPHKLNKVSATETSKIWQPKTFYTSNIHCIRIATFDYYYHIYSYDLIYFKWIPNSCLLI